MIKVTKEYFIRTLFFCAITIMMFFFLKGILGKETGGYDWKQDFSLALTSLILTGGIWVIGKFFLRVIKKATIWIGVVLSKCWVLLFRYFTYCKSLGWSWQKFFLSLLHFFVDITMFLAVFIGIVLILQEYIANEKLLGGIVIMVSIPIVFGIIFLNELIIYPILAWAIVVISRLFRWPILMWKAGYSGTEITILFLIAVIPYFWTVLKWQEAGFFSGEVRLFLLDSVTWYSSIGFGAELYARRHDGGTFLNLPKITDFKGE